MKENKGRIILLGIISIFALIIIFWAIGVSNTYNKKLVTGQAAQQSCEVVYDNTWKKIQQVANVTSEYETTFRTAYVEIMDSRFGEGEQTLMKWVQESNPTLDSGIYGTLMNTIEGSRNEFTLEQQKLIDIDRELKTMKVEFPRSIVVKRKPDLDIKLVKSAKTNETFATGEENDISLF